MSAPGRRLAALFHRSAAVAAVVSVVAAIAVAGGTILALRVAAPGPDRTASDGRAAVALPARPDSYLGAFVRGVPASYAPVQSLAAATGTRPNLALYYSGWGERFQAGFARQAARHGAVPLVQVDPGKLSLTAIADGVYDGYLRSFALEVARYGAQTGGGVIIGFAHEPNGYWYPWGYHHASPAAFVAAWRHIVTVFRQAGAANVTWLWTVNIVDLKGGIPSPAAWWPGRSYVTWVGIDGYYLRPSWKFAPLFGPTIKAVRALTLDPILISETAAAPVAGKPAKIANLFAGVRAYGLLGLVWFDVDKNRDWRLAGPAAIAAFRRGARGFSLARPPGAGS